MTIRCQGGIPRGRLTWGHPPPLRPQSNKKREIAGKATNLSEFNQSCWWKKVPADYGIRLKPELKLIPKGLCDEGAANGDDPHLTNGKRLIESDKRERNIMPKNMTCVQKMSEMT
jgi:hypothetical protein